jgi:hypothetical protein
MWTKQQVLLFENKMIDSHSKSMFINVDYSPSPYPSHQGRGLFIKPLRWWDRAGVGGFYSL